RRAGLGVAGAGSPGGSAARRYFAAMPAPRPSCAWPVRFSTIQQIAETIAAAGMVSTHAHTMRPATPHFTAVSRWVALTPEPTIEPVIVWVVDTGMPAALAPNSASAPAV